MDKPATGFSKLALILSCLACLGVGLCGGFLLGFSTSKFGQDFLADIAESEESADLSTTQTHDRARFRLEYPGNWKLDLDSDGFDPDAAFSLDSPGSSFVMILVSEGTSVLNENIRGQVKAYREMLPDLEQRPLESYGTYEAAGRELTGKFFGIAMTVRVYSFRSDGLTFIVAEQCYDEDAHLVEPGLELIRQSLQTKPAADD